ncbi:MULTISPECIES: hypothetical protein [unclassified Methylobacterium]|uniref:hypothetical protein n=1 Tax=unclassified Methylobacterium TaxID=2615210 RepID=UPI0036F8CD5D
MRTPRGHRSGGPEALFVGFACTLVFLLFLAMTVGGALVGDARQEGAACVKSCR